MNYSLNDNTTHDGNLCEPLAEYSSNIQQRIIQPDLFSHAMPCSADDDVRVVELFAGVGGFRIGLERASKHFKTIWSNQWEPTTKRQDASIIYCNRFGVEGHSNEDIATVPTDAIPDCDILCGGFPCQDYSVATTLKRSEGIKGKKGVLWWQIYRILLEKGKKRPNFLMLENVDRLVNSPAKQRGRDFAIILASLSDLGYAVEWRIINAAEYGMPQRRKRTYIVAYHTNTVLAKQLMSAVNKHSWLLQNGVMAQAFPCTAKNNLKNCFKIEGEITEVSETFNKNKATSPFKNSGVMYERNVYTMETEANYSGRFLTLNDMLINEAEVPNDFFIPTDEIPKWEYQKGQKSLKRVNKTTGFEYNYSEGAMAFPDYLNRASRTIITGEGGAAPSRFKHVVKTESGRYRRLVPIELERLNMFPDNHTAGASDTRRAFLMGNALVTGVIENIAAILKKRM